MKTEIVYYVRICEINKLFIAARLWKKFNINIIIVSLLVKERSTYHQNTSMSCVQSPVLRWWLSTTRKGYQPPQLNVGGVWSYWNNSSTPIVGSIAMRPNILLLKMTSKLRLCANKSKEWWEPLDGMRCITISIGDATGATWPCIADHIESQLVKSSQFTTQSGQGLQLTLTNFYHACKYYTSFTN